MKASFKKETLPDPKDAGGSYENFILERNVEFCCNNFKAYCKKFTCWDYEKGKFSIIDNITYDGNSTIVIDFCPFCGEKIEYHNEAKSNKTPKK